MEGGGGGAEPRVEVEEAVGEEGVAVEAGFDEVGVEGLGAREGVEREAAVNEDRKGGKIEFFDGSKVWRGNDH